jgi:effector-binding domain-containing protein
MTAKTKTVTTTKPGECRIVTVERQLTAAARAQVRIDEIPEMQRSLRRKIKAAVQSLDVGPLGDTCTLWRPLADGRLDLEPGILVARAFDPVGEIVPSALPAGRAAHFLYVGPYAGLSAAWQTLFAWCTREGLKRAGINWEIYGNEDCAQPETSLHALLA